MKINKTLIDNAEDLDIVMSIKNLLEYSKNYRRTTGSLWNNYRNEPNSGAVGNINYFIKESKSFNYKTSITGTLEGNNVKKRDADPDADPAVAGINNPTNAVFKIKDTKLYIPVVSLSAENDNKPSEQLKAGFKRTIKLNKYRSEIPNQTINNNLNYLIDPKFTNMNRLFPLMKMKKIELLFQNIM